MSLTFNWYKSYGKKQKNAKNAKDANVCFCTKSKKKNKWKLTLFDNLINKLLLFPQMGSQQRNRKM